ncbi:MAG: hypothetical protein V4671_21040, partial [Armatimonadota bacterium]
LGVFFAFLLLTAGALSGGCGSGGDNGGLQNIVRGIVRDSANGDNPVGGATVTIGGKTGTTATTDGSFTITGASLGSTTAVVTVPGQAAQTIAFEPAVGPGTLDGLILTLNIGQIRGKVTLANQPVDGARVTDLTTGFEVFTKEDGTFLLESIPAGATSVIASVTTAAKTVPVTVVNGLTDIGTIVLEEDTNTNPPGPPSGTLVGKITLSDQTSATAGAGTLVFLQRNGVQVDQAVTDANAEFRFYALPGTGYSLLVRKNAYQDEQSDVFDITNPAVPLRKDLTLDLM